MLLGYFVGLGSNIEPAKHLASAIERLAGLAKGVALSRIIRTSPVDFPSSREFLNAVAYLETNLDCETLKERLNGIEIELGRDRADPHKATKDRTIDLDILLQIPSRIREISPSQIVQEFYHRTSFLELLRVLDFACPLAPEPVRGATTIACGGGDVGLTPFRVEPTEANTGFRITHWRAALVTGGAVRLGRAIASLLAQAGYDIALHYNSSQAAAQEAAEEFISKGVRCELFPYDLTESHGLDDLISTVFARMPHLNLLVNSASVYEHGHIMDTTVEMLDRQWAVNFKAPLFLMKAFHQRVEHGSIINIIDNKIAYNQFQYAAYLTSKKALAELTKMAALEFAPRMRVNGVAPGVVLPATVRSESYLEWRKAAIPVHELGSPANVCGAISAILTNSFINGQILFVDGGEGINLVGRNALEFGKST